MRTRLLTIAKWSAYPLFYLFCLGLFGYLTFPYERLKDWITIEFQRTQSKRGGTTQRLEIDKISSYWFSGVEVFGARLIMPPDPTDFAAAKASAEEGKAPKETVIEIEEGHARVRILPLLIGRVRVDFAAAIFGGTVEGTVPVGAGGAMEVELEDVDLGKVEPLVATVGVPMKGTLNGALKLAATEGKFNKANGSLDLTVTGAAVGDGKTKIKGQLALPEAKIGELTISAEAKDGALKVTKLSGTGDIELVGDGKVSLREPWTESRADLYLRFKFADSYRNKSDITKSLLGAPGSTAPALFELADPRIKRSKRTDGFYGWHVSGRLAHLKFDPSTSDGPKGRGESAASPTAPAGFKKPTLSMPTMRDTPTPPPVREPTPLPVREPPKDEPPTPAPAPEPEPPPPAPEPAREEPQQPEPEPAPAPQEEEPAPEP